jgi:N-glycosylase/DNA lyase
MSDIIQVKCIKNETERPLTRDKDIKNKWWEYFDKFFNEDSESSSIELNISSYDLNRQFMCRIQEHKIKDVVKRMKGGKTMSSDGIHIKVWRSLEDVAIVSLTKLFNIIFRSNKMPNE